jgi:hypothetical protein
MTIRLRTLRLTHTPTFYIKPALEHRVHLASQFIQIRLRLELLLPWRLWLACLLVGSIQAAFSTRALRHWSVLRARGARTSATRS